MKLSWPIAMALALWSGTAFAQVPLDPKTMQPAEIEGLQRRLTDARCYAGVPDGRPSDALTTAIAACPDQRPTLRIETGMHVAQMSELVVDRSCTMAATGSRDKTVRLWSLPDGRLLRTQRLPIGDGHLGKINGVAISPDGAWVAAGGWDASDAVEQKHYVYMFDAAAGQSIRRFGGFTSVILKLVFSPDGSRLAVGLGGGLGVRLFDAATGQQVAADDKLNGESAYSLAFAPDGRLFASGADGSLRSYGSDGRKIAQVRTRGGKEPSSVALDPAGHRIAVTFRDAGAVDLYDDVDLRFRSTAGRQGQARGYTAAGWSSDGRTLYAGGITDSRAFVRAFTRDGQQIGVDVTYSNAGFDALLPCGDRIAFAESEPSFGLISPDGSVATLVRGRTPDMRGKLGELFAVSSDGRRVRFDLAFDARGVRSPVLFDLASGSVVESAGVPTDLRVPLLNGVTNWLNSTAPRIGNSTIPLRGGEASRSLAVRPDRGGFVLGADSYIYAYDLARKKTWEKSGPGVAGGVNLARGGELIVVAYGDGTIRWHRWSDGAELLALFVNKDTKQWVAWTPTGYYKASAGGEDMIGWHVNRGWEQPADFFPASKFRDTYARADIVDRVLDTLDEAEAIRQANATRPDKGAAKPITDLLPPVVAILSPAEGATMSGEEVRIDYLVRSPAGLPVDAVEALVDGRPASRERGLGRPDGNAVSALRECLTGTRGLGRAEGGGLQGCRGSLTVRLPPGAREIGLFARTGDRAGDVAKIRIVRDAGATADAEGTKPKLYALVVGISAYANADYTLQYAAKDARDFAAALQNQTGGVYADVIVRRLTDGEATHNGVLDGLEWLTKQVTVRDVGLVYLAGHGVLDDRDRFYFVAADSDIDRLRATGVPREDIQDALDALPGKALLFLDACHAGAVGLSKVRRESVDINGVANEFSRTERGLVMFTASTGKQVSQENAAWGNGAFTKAVIEGLGTPGQRGKADLLGKGTISTSALDVYVSERVKELTGGRQSPVMIRPSTVPDFTLAAVRN